MPVASASYASLVSSTVVLDAAVPAASSDLNKTIRSDLFSTTLSLNPTSGPPVTLAASFYAGLVAGAATIDLMALPGITAVLVAGGKKVQVFKLANRPATGTNAGPVTVTAGATTPYLLFGAAGSVVVPVGAEVTLYTANLSDTVDATHRLIALTGTLTDSVQVTVWAG